MSLKAHLLCNLRKQAPPFPWEGNAGRRLVISLGSINCGDVVPEHSLQYYHGIPAACQVVPLFWVIPNELLFKDVLGETFQLMGPPKK